MEQDLTDRQKLGTCPSPHLHTSFVMKCPWKIEPYNLILCLYVKPSYLANLLQSHPTQTLHSSDYLLLTNSIHSLYKSAIALLHLLHRPSGINIHHVLVDTSHFLLFVPPLNFRLFHALFF